MKTDKEFALDLLGWLERYQLRASIMEYLLNHSNVRDWKQKAAKMMQDPDAQALLHRENIIWRDTILNSPDITTAAQQILESLNKREPGGY
jgi:hypothetical protein